MVVACRKGAFFLRFVLACKTPKNNALSAGYDRYEATVKELTSLVAESLGTDHLERPTWSTLASLFSEEIGQMKPRLGQDLAKYLVDQMQVKKRENFNTFGTILHGLK